MTENWRCDHGKPADDYCDACEKREQPMVVIGICREDNPRDVDEAYERLDEVLALKSGSGEKA